MPIDPQFVLQPHQQRVRDEAEEAARTGTPYRKLLRWSPGSGKSFGALGIADALGAPATIIGPAALRQTLKGESTRLLGHNDYPVYSYSAAARGKVAPAETLVVDEAQALNSPTSARSRAVLDLIRQAKNVVLMSATPVKNRPEEFAPLMSALTGNQISHDEFAAKYVGTEKRRPGFVGRVLGRPTFERPAVVNREELKKLLSGKVDYYDTPTPPVPVEQKDVDAELRPRQADLYRGLFGKLPWATRQKLKWQYPLTDQEMISARSFLTGPRQATLSDLPYRHRQDPLKAFAASGKLTKAYQSMTETLKDPRAKGIVYSNFIDAGLRPYSAKLTAEGVPNAVFHGGLSDQERKDLVDRFNRGDIRTALIAPAGSEGISLRGAQKTQLLDEYWSNVRNTQAKARGIRYDSHTGLPDDLKNMTVERYAAKLPLRLKDKLLSRFGFDRERERETTDDYLRRMSERKDDLNRQLDEVLRESSQTKHAADLVPGLPSPAARVNPFAAVARKLYSGTTTAAHAAGDAATYVGRQAANAATYTGRQAAHAANYTGRQAAEAASAVGRGAKAYAKEVTGYGTGGKLEGQKLFDSTSVKPRLTPTAYKAELAAGAKPEALAASHQLPSWYHRLPGMATVGQVGNAMNRNRFLHPFVQAWNTTSNLMSTPFTRPFTRPLAQRLMQSGTANGSRGLTRRVVGRGQRALGGALHGVDAAAGTAGKATMALGTVGAAQSAWHLPANVTQTLSEAADPANMPGGNPALALDHGQNPEVRALRRNPLPAYRDMLTDRSETGSVLKEVVRKHMPYMSRQNAANSIRYTNSHPVYSAVNDLRSLTPGGRLTDAFMRSYASDEQAPTQKIVEDAARPRVPKILANYNQEVGSPLARRLIKSLEFSYAAPALVDRAVGPAVNLVADPVTAAEVDAARRNRTTLESALTNPITRAAAPSVGRRLWGSKTSDDKFFERNEKAKKLAQKSKLPHIRDGYVRCNCGEKWYSMPSDKQCPACGRTMYRVRSLKKESAAGTICEEVHGMKSANEVYDGTGKQPRVRAVLPVADGQYLLEELTNQAYPERLGMTRFPGGGVEEGETPMQALVRELSEELRHAIDPAKVKHLGVIPHHQWGHDEHYFLVPDHGLTPGDFAGAVGGDPTVRLTAAKPEGPKYFGPDVSSLLSQNGRGAGVSAPAPSPLSGQKTAAVPPELAGMTEDPRTGRLEGEPGPQYTGPRCPQCNSAHVGYPRSMPNEKHCEKCLHRWDDKESRDRTRDAVEEAASPLSGIRVLYKPGNPGRAFIDIMDWGDEEYGKLIGKKLTKVLGKDNVEYGNESNPPDCGDKSPEEAGWEKIAVADAEKLIALIAVADPDAEKIAALTKFVVPNSVDLLRQAKSYSDQGQYDQKAQIVRDMVQRAPHEWRVDSHGPGPNIVGLTHASGFRLHLPRHFISDLLPDADPVRKQMVGV